MPYQVGYKKPPKASQFQKGKSGNPGGKPSALVRGGGASAELYQTVRKVKRRKVSAKRGNKTVNISGLEALLIQMINEAFQGNVKSREQFFKLVEKADLAALNGQVSEPLLITIIGGLPDD